jgi:hypothetical protein
VKTCTYPRPRHSNIRARSNGVPPFLSLMFHHKKGSLLGPLEPTVALVVNAGSLEFTVSYVVDYTKRTAMKDQLFTKIVVEVANSDGRLEWASSAVIPMRPSGDAGHESKALLPSSSALGAVHAADSR